MKPVKEQLDIMQAYLDGKTIKRTNKCSGHDSKFKKDTNPKNFNWEKYDYNIAQEPVVKYIIVSRSNIAYETYSELKDAKKSLNNLHSQFRIIRVVQDMDFNGDDE